MSKIVRNAIGLLTAALIVIGLLSSIAAAEQPIGKKFCDVWSVDGHCGIHSGTEFGNRIDDWSKSYTGIETDKYERAAMYLDQEGVDTINIVAHVYGGGWWTEKIKLFLDAVESKGLGIRVILDMEPETAWTQKDVIDNIDTTINIAKKPDGNLYSSVIGISLDMEWLGVASDLRTDTLNKIQKKIVTDNAPLKFFPIWIKDDSPIYDFNDRDFIKNMANKDGVVPLYDGLVDQSMETSCVIGNCGTNSLVRKYAKFMKENGFAQSGVLPVSCNKVSSGGCGGIAQYRQRIAYKTWYIFKDAVNNANGVDYFLLGSGNAKENPFDIYSGSRTLTGYIYPTALPPTTYINYGYDGARSYYQFSGWLARGDKDWNSDGVTDYFEGKYHPGQDIKTSLEDDVYAIADGNLVYVSTGGWGAGNVGIFVEHTLADGKKFWALYGHLDRSKLKFDIPKDKSGNPITGEINPPIPVKAGEAFAQIGYWSDGIHLHFGVHEEPKLPDYVENPAKGYGMISLSYWPDATISPSETNGFVDPTAWMNRGLRASYYNEPIYRNNIDAIAKPDVERIDPNVDFTWHTGASKLPLGILYDGWWSADFAGYIYIDKDGMYNFNLNSDDGSWLFIDGEKVIDNGGDHAPRWAWGQKTLTKGYHSIWVKYFESFGGEANLNLYWLPPDVMVYAPVPQDKLYVTAPEEISPKLQLSKKVPANMDPGNVMVYTLYYTNFGSKASNAEILDKLPTEKEVDFISASDGGVYDSTARTVKWAINSIDAFPNGVGSRTVTVRIKSDASLNTVIKNTATISYSAGSSTAEAQTTVTKSNLPSDVSISPITGNTGGNPSVFWRDPVTFSYYSDCATSVDIKILFSDGVYLTKPMVESSENMWTYTVKRFEPAHGEAKVTYTVEGCGETKTVSFNIYIDPAGFIYDITTGKRISNATVWLQQPDSQGNWYNVSTGQTPAIMQPDTNPLTTNQDGQYQWDVLTGTYRIHVEAPGYYSADSIAVNIPPPVTDLNVGLTHLPDDIPPTTTIGLTGIQGNNNWYTSDVEVNLTATDNEGGSGVKITEYSLDNIAWNTYSSPFNVTSEGITTVYYRSIDYADNSETVKAQTISIDKTPPNISIAGVTNNSYHNSNVTITVNITDVNLYNQSVVLNGYLYINGTNITEEGSYILVATAEDLAGNNASKTIDFVIDKTPPEASISFNTTTKNITVYDNDTKTEANYIVLPAKNNKDDDSDVEEHNEDNEGNESGWNLRKYTLEDQANNSFVLILKYKSEGKETKAGIISLQYNNGTIITVENSTIKAEHSVDKNGSIKELEQKIEVQKQFEIEAKYSLKKNETEIKVKTEKQKEEKETRPGLVILEILTDKGKLKYSY